MTSENFTYLVGHPEKLNSDTLYELRNMLVRYPYFQALRLLYLKNLYLLHDITFGSELRKAAVYITDRKKLFYLIEGPLLFKGFEIKKVQESVTDEGSMRLDRTLSLIDAFLASAPEEITSQTELDYSLDYTSQLLQQEGDSSESAPIVVSSRSLDLIDSFIESTSSENRSGNVEASLPKDRESEFVADNEKSDVFRDESEATVDEDDEEFFTETLAKIYVKQQRYAKALEIIKKLNLKYPKKNAYFADQIRFLEKLIINAKFKE